MLACRVALAALPLMLIPDGVQAKPEYVVAAGVARYRRFSSPGLMMLRAHSSETTGPRGRGVAVPADTALPAFVGVLTAIGPVVRAVFSVVEGALSASNVGATLQLLCGRGYKTDESRVGAAVLSAVAMQPTEGRRDVAALGGRLVAVPILARRITFFLPITLRDGVLDLRDACATDDKEVPGAAVESVDGSAALFDCPFGFEATARSALAGWRAAGASLRSASAAAVSGADVDGVAAAADTLLVALTALEDDEDRRRGPLAGKLYLA